MTDKANFGRALKKLRLVRGLTQEDFSLVSSRTYISTLERGIKSPTLEKIELLAETLKVSPLTLLALTFTRDADIDHAHELLNIVKEELTRLEE